MNSFLQIITLFFLFFVCRIFNKVFTCYTLSFHIFPNCLAFIHHRCFPRFQTAPRALPANDRRFALSQRSSLRFQVKTELRIVVLVRLMANFSQTFPTFPPHRLSNFRQCFATRRKTELKNSASYCCCCCYCSKVCLLTNEVAVSTYLSLFPLFQELLNAIFPLLHFVGEFSFVVFYCFYSPSLFNSTYCYS